MKKVMVISLGGSVIFPDKVDVRLLKKFRKILRKYYSEWKFVIVCGGGSIARKYIKALKGYNKTKKELALAGMRATRMNAMFVIQVFGNEANDRLPKDMIDVKNNLRRNNVVVCGALRYAKNSTSDSTAAQLANYLKSDFINITNIDGLYTSSPQKNKGAKFILEISWKEFEKRAKKIKFKAGQHFVLDQSAASIIKKNKIKTYIIGKKLGNLKKILRGRKFRGTTIGED